MYWIPAMVIGVVLIVVIGRILLRPDGSRAAALMKTYKTLTPALLAETPDEELVTAVVSNILAKAEAEKTDPYRLLPTLTQERSDIYSLWLFLRELEAGDPACLRRSEQFGFSELAVNALRMMEQTALADALDRYLQTADETLPETMKTLVAEQELPALMIAMIRSNPESFCDTPQ